MSPESANLCLWRFVVCVESAAKAWVLQSPIPKECHAELLAVLFGTHRCVRRIHAAKAFGELRHHYAKRVYSACRRVLYPCHLYPSKSNSLQYGADVLLASRPRLVCAWAKFLRLYSD